MLLKFIVIAGNENMFITVTNEIKISTLIIVDTHSMGNTKRKENEKKKNPKTNSKNKPQNFISRYYPLAWLTSALFSVREKTKIQPQFII